MNEKNEPRKEEVERPITNSTTEENQNQKQGRPVWVIVLAIAGILAVLTALGIGIFQLAGRAPENISQIGSSIANLFGREERLRISVGERTVESGVMAELTLEHLRKSEEGGAYTLEFECEEGVTAELGGGSVACNEEISLNSIDESIEFTLTSTQERYVDVPVVAYYVNAETELSTDILITVVNTDIEAEDSEDPEEDETTEGEAPSETETPTETPGDGTVERRGRESDPNGTQDLKLVVEETGYINEDGDFVAAEEIDEDQRAAATFFVVNDGTKKIEEGWYFSALLPVEDSYYFRSDAQPTLYPGDRVAFELAFDNIVEGKTLYINVDPSDKLKESDEDDNVRDIEFSVVK